MLRLEKLHSTSRDPFSPFPLGFYPFSLFRRNNSKRKILEFRSQVLCIFSEKKRTEKKRQTNIGSFHKVSITQVCIVPMSFLNKKKHNTKKSAYLPVRAISVARVATLLEWTGWVGPTTGRLRFFLFSFFFFFFCSETAYWSIQTSSQLFSFLPCCFDYSAHTPSRFPTHTTTKDAARHTLCHVNTVDVIAVPAPQPQPQPQSPQPQPP